MKPSELLETAMKDFAEVEKDPGYIIRMGDWHLYDDETHKCSVCLAGAWLAKSVRLPIETSIVTFDEISKELFAKITGIDYLRRGSIDIGLKELGIDFQHTNVSAIMRVTHYTIDPNQFKLDIQNVINELKRVGL